MTMRIVTVQHALPARQVSNQDLIDHALSHEDMRVRPEHRDQLGQALAGFLEQCGAVTRFHRAPGERALDVGVAAGRKALEHSGVAADEIDLLIYVGVARGFLEPATANVFQAELGLHRATCFDILDACASWLRGVDIARHFLQVGTYRRIMILNCECNCAEWTRYDFESCDDISHLGAGLTVGEAATATILERDSGATDYYINFETTGAHHNLCQIPLPSVRQFSTNGVGRDHPSNRFFAYAAPLNRVAIQQLVRQYESDHHLDRSPPDIVFGHAPSVPSVETVFKILKLDRSALVETFPQYGNTVSASIPLAISLASRAGTLQRGMKVLVLMASAGVSTAVCRFTY